MPWRCLLDLTLDGCTWQNVRAWCEHYGAEMDEVWPVLRPLANKLRQKADA